ncbi:MAG: GIY-YIG nuclease family protein [Ruminococcus sp.]|nr:GIY-YIG nuclease family protein [Ruminococcus sp.]
MERDFKVELRPTNARSDREGYETRTYATFLNSGKLKLPAGMTVPLGAESGRVFDFCVDQDLIDSCKDENVKMILEDINSFGFSIKVSANKPRDWSRKDIANFYSFNSTSGESFKELSGKYFDICETIRKQYWDYATDEDHINALNKAGISVELCYLNLEIPVLLKKAFRKLFLNSYLCLEQNVRPKEYDAFTLNIIDDRDSTGAINRKLILTGLDLAVPPAEIMTKYLRGTHVALKQKSSTPSGDKPINYYDRENGVTGWMDVASNPINEITEEAGIYMLFDSVKNHLYVGKALNLRTRIKQHKDNKKGDDPIPDFDYYRYSTIDGNRLAEQLILENTAIHDLAMIFQIDSSSATGCYRDLALNIMDLFKNIPLGDIKLVNRQEQQTHWEKI